MLMVRTNSLYNDSDVDKISEKMKEFFYKMYEDSKHTYGDIEGEEVKYLEMINYKESKLIYFKRNKSYDPRVGTDVHVFMSFFRKEKESILKEIFKEVSLIKEKKDETVYYVDPGFGYKLNVYIHFSDKSDEKFIKEYLKYKKFLNKIPKGVVF